VWLSLVNATGYTAHTQAPSIQLPAIKGDVNLSQLRGKVVYLDFWASWFEPCRESFPWMAKLKDKYGNQDLEVIAVNLDKERDKADAFMKNMKINFIVAFDPAGETDSKYDLRGMPGSYLIGRDGNIHASHLGFRDMDKAKLETAIRRLLQQDEGAQQ
jgi:thiol-disulfide isomerase/thioredoxin